MADRLDQTPVDGAFALHDPAAAAAAAGALGELAGKEKYGTLPSWNVVVLCTVGGILFFELICHQMNHAAAGKRHAQELLETLYRELAILGVVAFILWSINVSPAVDIEYGDKHFFEQIHMSLFLAALLHTFFVGVVALYSRQVNRRWDIFENDEMRRYKDLKQQHRRTAQKMGIRHANLKQGIGTWRSAWLMLRHPILYRRLSELSEHVGYHAIRAHFIRSNQLPKNFRFASYLKKCEQSVVLNLAGIKEGVWVALILLVGAELFVKGLLGQAESSKDVIPIFITAAVVVMFTALAVHRKLKSIYTTIIRSYQASTDRKDDLMQFFGPGTTTSMVHKDLFWLSSPGAMVVALQSVQFLLAIMVGALIWFGTTDSTGVMIFAEVVLGVGAFGIYTIVLPKFIPKFTTVTHVGAMVNRHILSECLVKQRRAFQHRSLPPTLRQVAVMARNKANDDGKNEWLCRIKKLMAGHAWREFLQVLTTIHFFVVAYNVDPIRDGVGSMKAIVSELCLGCLAAVLEMASQVVVWKGHTPLRCSLFVSVPDYSAGMGATEEAPEASVYPSSSRQHLLGHGSAHSNSVTGDQKGDNVKTLGDAQSALSPQKGGTLAFEDHHSHNAEKDGNASASARNDFDGGGGGYFQDTRFIRRWSLWACFGWNGEDKPKRPYGIPPSARTGWWRAVDFLLVVVVCATSIYTFFDADHRVVHALQGLVVLRWLPLLFGPYPPASGHDDLHDVGGATVHQEPLDHNTRNSVLRETLALLRGQNRLSAAFDRNLALGENEREGGDGTTTVVSDKHAGGNDGSATKHSGAGAAEEVKDDGTGGGNGDAHGDGHGGGAGGIANIGVAVALREACAAHPELVQTHGPLSAPILRAMLGLDPHKTGGGREDDDQDLTVTAEAVASLARGFRRSESTAGGGDGDGGGFSTPARSHLRKPASHAFSGGGQEPPSPSRMSNSSSSSSELSSSEEEEERHARKVSGASSSWLGGGGGGGGGSGGRHPNNRTSESAHSFQHHQQHMMFQQQQQQLMYHQQQQMQFHYQLQQHQQRHGVQQNLSSMEGGAAAPLPLGARLGAHGYAGPLFAHTTHGYMSAPYAGGVGPYGIMPHPAGFDPYASGSYQTHKMDRSYRSQRSAGGKSKASSSVGGRGRSRSRGRSTSLLKRSGSAGGGGDMVVPLAIEDIEGPVLRSFASGGDNSQHGRLSGAPTPRASVGGGSGGGGGGGLSIPFGSGRSIPFSSSHRRAARLGPRGPPSGSSVFPAAGTRPPRRARSLGTKSDILGQAATDAAVASLASDATAAASTSSTSAGAAAADDVEFGRKGSNAE